MTRIDQAPRVGTRYVPSGEYPLLRPKDAASIILIDRSEEEPRFLVGKRGKAHTFLPDYYVFPGGRRDPADSRIKVARPLPAPVLERLLEQTDARMSEARARGLAVAAVRETHEEAGLKIAAQGPVARHPDWRGFAEHGLAPDLSALRYVARATTPPRQSRRFDTRFFACFLDEIDADPRDVRDSAELHGLTWIRFDELDSVPLPRITRTILGDLEAELDHDRTLPFGRPVPFYTVRHGIFVRDIIG